MALRILHTNDLHGKLTDQKLDRLKLLREQADIYLDAGDAVLAGNLAIPLKPEEVWAKLAKLNCTASCMGNRESHPLSGPFHKKLQGATHTLLCANLRDKSGKQPLPGHLFLEVNQLKIGIFSVMVPMVTPRMKTAAMSNYLWGEPFAEAQRQVQELRSKVELLIALTHIGFEQDKLLARNVPGIDLIVGGHSHTVLEQPVHEGTTWIVQAGSHSRFAGLFTWDEGIKDYRLCTL